MWGVETSAEKKKAGPRQAPAGGSRDSEEGGRGKRVEKRKEAAQGETLPGARAVTERVAGVRRLYKEKRLFRGRDCRERAVTERDARARQLCRDESGPPGIRDCQEREQ